MDNPSFHVTCLLELFLAAKSIQTPGNRKRDHWTKFSETCKQLILPGQYAKSKQTLGNSKTCKNSQSRSAAVRCTPVPFLHFFIAEQSQNREAGMLNLALNSNWCWNQKLLESMEKTLGTRFPLELSAYPENTKRSARVEQIRNTLQIINCGLSVDLMTEPPRISRRVRWDTLRVWSVGEKDQLCIWAHTQETPWEGNIWCFGSLQELELINVVSRQDDVACSTGKNTNKAWVPWITERAFIGIFKVLLGRESLILKIQV